MANAIGFLWERRLQTKASRSRILWYKKLRTTKAL